MSEDFRVPFSNPYVDESTREALFSTVVTMDEAHERWKKGQWKADKANFSLDDSFLNDDRMPAVQDKPEANRFAFDLHKDIIEGDVDSSRLDGIAYTASYRPQGSISSNISNLTVDRLRYNALADIKEDIPDDLSYLYGGVSRRTGAKKRARTKSRSHDRLAAPVDKRRAQVDKMLPEQSMESPEKIMADIRKHRDIEDAKSGIVRDTRKRRYSRGIYDFIPEPGTVEKFSNSYEEYSRDEVNERGSWRSEIPVQDGLVPDTKELPYFGRYSRRWSEIDPINPTRSEMLIHTVNTIYDDDDAPQKGENEYSVSERDFDPRDRYRPLGKQRRTVRAGDNVLQDSVTSGEFNNPYVEISNEKLQELLNHDMRGPGNLPEPEGLTDPSLLYEWNMGYSRMNAGEGGYSKWMEEQSRLAQDAEQSRYRGSHRAGRPGAYMQRETPYGEARRYPRHERREREVRRRDMSEQFKLATERGIADGREIIRRQQMEQQRQWQQYYAQQQNYYRKQQEQMMKQQQAYARKQADVNARTRQGGAKPQNPPTQGNGNAPGMPQYGAWGYYSPMPPKTAAATPNKNTAQPGGNTSRAKKS